MLRQLGPVESVCSAAGYGRRTNRHRLLDLCAPPELRRAEHVCDLRRPCRRHMARPPPMRWLRTDTLPWRAVTLWAELAAPWKVCLEQAWAAYRAGSLPIGAVVVDPDSNIVGRGRNRIFEMIAEPPENKCLFGHRLAHAEINALISVDHATVDIKQCVLYTTLEPCALCVGAIRMLALKDVRYAARDAAAGSLALFDATEFMRRGDVQAQHLGHAELEVVLIGMNTDALLSISERFELSLRLDRWQSAGMQGIDFGRKLFDSSELQRLAHSPGMTIEHVLDELVTNYRRGASATLAPKVSLVHLPPDTVERDRP
jgi:tRNA(adenine34) deaminase